MQTTYSLYLVINLLGTLLLIIMAVYAWSRRHETNGAMYLTGLLGAAIFSNAMFFGLGISQSVGSALLFGHARFTGIVLLPALMLCFAFAYTGKHVPLKLLLGLEVVPALALVLLWTNPQHVFYVSWTIHIEEGMVFERIHYAAGYYLYVVYQYFLMGWSYYVLLNHSWRSRGIHQAQYLLVAIAAILVGVLNVPSALALIPFTFPNLSSFAIFVIALTFTLTYFRFRLLDIRPIAAEMITSSMPDGVLVIDNRGRVASVNPPAEKLMDKAGDEVIGKPVQTIFSGQPALAEWIEKAAPEHQEFHLQIDGKERIYEVRSSPIHLRTGDVLGRILLMRDVSAARMSQKLELEHERMKLVNAFITGSSHDLRTPLSIINTSVHLLRRSSDPAMKEVRLKAIEEQSMKLAHWIDQFHELVQVSQTEKIITTPIQLNDIQGSVITSLLVLANGKHITIQWDLAPDLPVIEGNYPLVVRAFEKLLHNALVYTPEGGSVTIRTYCQLHKAAKMLPGPTILEVTDTGIGIDPEQQPHIFDQFYKGDLARSSGDSGAGLGLTIAKMIMDLHGGCITFESVPHQGSTFRLEFPAQPVEAGLSNV
ncbi:MAG: histidine kinase N-terminal 7TM domain-containing protein [Anaerolineae bacterium]